MADSSSGGSSGCGCGCVYFIPALLSGMIAYHLNSGVFALLFIIWDFLFWPLALLKWIFCHELSISLFHAVFPWFFQ